MGNMKFRNQTESAAVYGIRFDNNEYALVRLDPFFERTTHDVQG